VENKRSIRFARLLELHIVNLVNKKFAGTKTTIDGVVLHELRDMVKEQVHTIFKKSSHKVTDEGLNWVANQLFKNLTLETNEGKKPIVELVIFNEYKLADLPYSDIQLLHNLFNETAMGSELEDEHKRRSVA
jgi:hypothetical protein